MRKFGFIDNLSPIIRGEKQDGLLVTVNGGESFESVNIIFPLDIKDTTLLQEFFIFSVNEKWVIGTFHCPYTQKRDWVNIIKQMLLSIHLEE